MINESERPFHIYIAGGMESVGGNMNFPLFDEVSEKLREAGYTVLNPADHMRKEVGTLEDIMKISKVDLRAYRRRALKEELSWICEFADAVVMLPGWRSSPGATAEFYTALAMDLPVHQLGNQIVGVQHDVKKMFDVVKTEE